MTFESPGQGALDYLPVRYGHSKLVFRGPARPLEPPYAAVFGGTETYGKFIRRPYPALVEAASGLTTVNLGCVNAGLDAYLGDPELLSTARNAAVTVVQVMGAHNLSNRFYTVHPRRNDRFLKPSPHLLDLFRDVDFTDFTFTRHMLRSLRERAPERFDMVVDELRLAWMKRMRLLLERIEGDTVLLWIAAHAPGPRGSGTRDPLFVDSAMIEAVAPLATHYVEVVASQEARAAGTRGMVYTDFEAPAAATLPGPMLHEEVAEALAPILADYAAEAILQSLSVSSGTA